MHDIERRAFVKGAALGALAFTVCGVEVLQFDPDLTIAGRGGCIFRECKTEAGSLSPEQRHVGELITRAGGNWAVWRPTQRLDGTIGRELASLAAVQLALFGAAP